MKYIVDDKVVLSRPLEGPLSANVAGFAKWARDEGYASPSRWRKVFLAAGFSRWLGQQAVSVGRISSEHVARYLRSHVGPMQIRRGDAATLRQFIDLLRRQGVVPPEKILPCRLTPVERAADAFARYLRNERALAEAAVVNYVPFVRRFLADRFGDRPVRLSRLCADDVVRICPAPGPTPAFEARETPDHRAAVLLAVCTLSRGHHL